MTTLPGVTTAVELKAQINAERGGLPFLVYRDETGGQRIATLQAETEQLSVGRHESADICLEWDGEISGLHALFERAGEEWTLVDDGLSRNGTFVNGQRLRGRNVLRDRDLLRMGSTTVLFRSPAQKRARSTQVAVASLTPSDVSDAQRRVLIALCRPFKDGVAFAGPPSNQEIAAELHLSVDAVKTHLRGLFHKLDVARLPQNRKRLALVQRALQSGLISDRDL